MTTLFQQSADQLKLFLQDLSATFSKSNFWIHLAWEDISKQYRRSFLGPVWITLNTALFVIAFGMIGAQLFNVDVKQYLPYFCTGHVLFTFIISLMTEGCTTYISAEAFIKHANTPKIALALRVVLRNFFMLLHNLPVVLLILLWAGALGQVRWMALSVGLMVTLLCASMVTALLGLVSARFRDVPMMVTSVTQLAFFITPVMWQPTQLTERAQQLVTFNPLAAFLDVLRAPLLGVDARASSWSMIGVILVIMSALFVSGFVVARRRIAYWI
jgi:lipopolysaccharide transport system permease protein